MRKILTILLVVLLTFTAFGALDFENDDTDYLRWKDQSIFNYMHSSATMQWTLMFWFQIESHQTYNTIFANQTGSDSQIGISILLDASGDLALRLGDGSGNYMCFFSGVPFLANTDLAPP